MWTRKSCITFFGEEPAASFSRCISELRTSMAMPVISNDDESAVITASRRAVLSSLTALET